jgi:hypothetical protein
MCLLNSLTPCPLLTPQGRDSGGAISLMPVLAPHMHIDAPTHLLHLKRASQPPPNVIGGYLGPGAGGGLYFVHY